MRRRAPRCCGRRPISASPIGRSACCGWIAWPAVPNATTSGRRSNAWRWRRKNAAACTKGAGPSSRSPPCQNPPCQNPRCHNSRCRSPPRRNNRRQGQRRRSHRHRDALRGHARRSSLPCRSAPRRSARRRSSRYHCLSCHSRTCHGPICRRLLRRSRRPCWRKHHSLRRYRKGGRSAGWSATLLMSATVMRATGRSPRRRSWTAGRFPPCRRLRESSRPAARRGSPASPACGGSGSAPSPSCPCRAPRRSPAGPHAASAARSPAAGRGRCLRSGDPRNLRAGRRG